MAARESSGGMSLANWKDGAAVKTGAWVFLWRVQGYSIGPRCGVAPHRFAKGSGIGPDGQATSLQGTNSSVDIEWRASWQTATGDFSLGTHDRAQPRHPGRPGTPVAPGSSPQNTAGPCAGWAYVPGPKARES